MAVRTVTYDEGNYGGAGIVRRISWGAVLAGVAVTIAAQFALSLLGLGIGMGAIDPMDPGAAKDFGIGAAIWWVVTVLVSLFLGGMVAGHLAGIPRRADATLHGVLTWSVSLILSLYLMTSAVGGLLGGALNVVGQASAAAGQEIGRDAARGPEQARAQAEQTWDSIKREAQEMLSGAGSAGESGQAQDSPGAGAGLTAEREQRAREDAAEAASTAAQASLWGFVGLILGCAAAAWGGRAGVPKETLAMTDAGTTRLVDTRPGVTGASGTSALGSSGTPLGSSGTSGASGGTFTSGTSGENTRADRERERS